MTKPRLQRPALRGQEAILRVPKTPLGSRGAPTACPRDYLLRARDLLARLVAFLAAFFAGRRALLTFFVAFLAAGLPLRAAFLAAEACFLLAGAFLAGVMGAAAAGIAGAGVEGMLGAGMAGLAGAAAGILIASSHPGVNISRRSREIALARPQRGHRAS